MLALSARATSFLLPCMIMMDTNIDQLDREHLECKLCLEDYHYTIEDAKWIKDEILQVELPSVMFQSTMIARLELRLNDTNYGCRQIKLENAAAILENAWQLCSDPVTSLSEAFDVRFVNIQDIDEFLSASLEKKLSISDLRHIHDNNKLSSIHIAYAYNECQ